MKRILVFCLALAMSGCAVVGPDYSRPNLALSERFTFDGTADLRDVAYDRWWTGFDDPALDVFMEEGLARNLDIRVARARILAAEAALRATGVSQQVSGSVVAEAGRGRINGRTFQTDGSDSVRLNASYVFDLFGGVRRGRQAAAARLAAQVLEEGATRLAYQAELVGALIDARFFQAATRSTNETIGSRRRILGLTNDLFDNGLVTRNDQVRARAELAQAEADLPGYANGARLAAIRIAVLLDQPVAPVLARLERTAGRWPVYRGDLTAGVPVNLLRNRPDVMAAEQRLIASFAQIGVREAALYPSLQIAGSVQLDGDTLVTAVPQLSVPLLDRGRLIAQRDQAAAAAVESDALWRQELRDAIGEVENGLTTFQTASQEIAALSRALSQFQTLADLSRETFQIGDTTLLELLDTDQNVQVASLELVQARRAQALAAARLAVATGRGYLAGTVSTREGQMEIAAAGKY